MKRLSALSLLAAAWLFATAVQAIPFTFFTTLSGPAENPSNASPGTGFAIVTFDPVAHLLGVHVEFANLLGTTTASHIHCCIAPPGNVMVATALPTFPGFPLGVTAGTYDQVFDTTLASTWNPAFLTAHGGIPGAEADLFAGLLSGQAYLNVHTNLFPGGEIRGFLQLPEPATLALLGMALVAAGLARRRR
jgi:hypothetical protein